MIKPQFPLDINLRTCSIAVASLASVADSWVECASRVSHCRSRRYLTPSNYVPFFQCIQRPLGRRRVQMRHALPNQSGGSRWQKQLQPFDGELSRIRNAAGIEPQNAEGQRRIDGTLQSPVYASTAKADCPLRNKPRAYTGPKDRSKSSTSSAGPRQSQESGAAAPVAALAGTPRARRVLQWAFDGRVRCKSQAWLVSPVQAVALPAGGFRS
jgi:hypothetical protein